MNTTRNLLNKFKQGRVEYFIISLIIIILDYKKLMVKPKIESKYGGKIYII